MSYFGTRVFYLDWSVTIKIHGPLDSFEIDPQKIKEDAVKALDTFISADRGNSEFKLSTKVTEYSNKLADTLADLYCNGSTRVWVEITTETMGKYTSMYSTSSVRLDREDVAKV